MHMNDPITSVVWIVVPIRSGWKMRDERDLRLGAAAPLALSWRCRSSQTGLSGTRARIHSVKSAGTIAHPEHDAPGEVGRAAEERVDELEGRRGEQIAPVPAAQHQARGEAAQLAPASARGRAACRPPTRRPCRGRRARAARTASRTTWRTRSGTRRARTTAPTASAGSLRPHLSAAVPAIVPPTSRMISVTVPSSARERAVDGEALLDVDDDEGEDVEVERVDDPAEEDGPERAPLIARDLPIPR